MMLFKWLAAVRRLAQCWSLTTLMVGLAFVVLLVWLGIWLVGSPTCESSRRFAIGETMLVAGCK
jgi:hypothetical protein